MSYVIMGTCGEYSNRTVWPSCVVENEAEAQDLVGKFQSETRALLMAWREAEYDEQFDRPQFERLLQLLPDPAIRMWPEKDVVNRDHSIQYIRPDEWSYYYVEVGSPTIRPLIIDFVGVFD